MNVNGTEYITMVDHERAINDLKAQPRTTEIELSEARLVAQKLFDALEKLSPEHEVSKELGGLYDYLSENIQLRKVVDGFAEACSKYINTQESKAALIDYDKLPHVKARKQ